ncbi:MAG: carbon-nitrogen hydrolase family protein [Candidatus Hodarchaeales archaeon]
MNNLIISVIQPNIRQNDLKWNINNYEKIFTDFSSEIEPSNVVCLPEYWNGIKDDKWSETLSERSLDYLEKVASNFGVWVIGGSQLVHEENEYFNRSHIFDPSGNLVGVYDKHYPFGIEKYRRLGQGKKLFFWNINDWKTSIKICSDLWVPGEQIQLLRNNVDLIFCPIMSSVPKESLTNYGSYMWHSLAVIRGKEAASALIVSDWARQAIKEPHWTCGASCIVDPSKKFQNNEPIANNIVTRSNTNQTIIMKELNLTEIREQRNYRINMGLIPVE